MQHGSERNPQAEGPFGVRAGVWLAVFGMLLFSVLMIRLSTEHTKSQPREVGVEDAVGESGSPRWRAHALRAVEDKSTHRNYESAAGDEIGEAQLSLIEQTIQDRRTWIDGWE